MVDICGIATISRAGGDTFECRPRFPAAWYAGQDNRRGHRHSDEETTAMLTLVTGGRKS